MNTDYQDIKSYKNQISVGICENLCPNEGLYHLEKGGDSENIGLCILVLFF